MQTNVTGTLWTVVAAALALLVSAPAAHAQDKVMATVPFKFFVGKTPMPAGDYMIRENSDWSVVTVAGERNGQASLALTMAASTNEQISQPELVFDKIGDTYFLERIVIDQSNVRELPLTSAMKARAAEHVAVVLRPAAHVS